MSVAAGLQVVTVQALGQVGDIVEGRVAVERAALMSSRVTRYQQEPTRLMWERAALARLLGLLV